MDECPLYTDPELYDSLFPNAVDSASIQDEARRERLLASERFYLEEARKSGGRVLELACGTGRLTIPIAQSGVEIIGADLSASMLETARAKAQRAGVHVEFFEADMRSFELAGPFSTILIPGNSLLHLFTADDLTQCFRDVRRHLAQNGRLIFDISNWDLAVLARDPTTYDAPSQIRNLTWSLSDSRSIEYRLRVIFPQELLLLLDAAGFRLDARYGEFTREPFQSSSPRQVCICSASAP
jgi:2-polyprenyl-3-methyl-5-hydroxy-6-metoxy-1,4-benzoquinol methylase